MPMNELINWSANVFTAKMTLRCAVLTMDECSNRYSDKFNDEVSDRNTVELWYAMYQKYGLIVTEEKLRDHLQ